MDIMLPTAYVSCKWKEVLGFDVGSSRRNKCHNTSRSQARQDFYKLSTNAASTTSSISQKCQLSYPRLPREIMLFHRRNEILISAPPSSPLLPSSPTSSSTTFSTPRPLFYITLGAEIPSHNGRPDITLHAGPDKASMVVCFAKLYSSSPIIDMTLCPPPKKSISANFSSENLALPLPVSSLQTTLYNTRSKHATPYIRSSQRKKIRAAPLSQFRMERLVRVFDPLLASYKYVFSYGNEAFEWRRVKPLAHHNHNYQLRSSPMASDSMKLIRASTGEVLVVYRQVAASSNWESEANAATAKMRFRRTESMDALAEDFDIFVVVSLVSIIEKERRELGQSLS